MQLDYGGSLDGHKAFRVIGTRKVFSEVRLQNVVGTLRSPTINNGVIEVEGTLTDNGDGTAMIEGATTHEASLVNDECRRVESGSTVVGAQEQGEST